MKIGKSNNYLYINIIQPCNFKQALILLQPMSLFALFVPLEELVPINGHRTPLVQNPLLLKIEMFQQKSSRMLRGEGLENLGLQESQRGL
jgi:hypothetical protein